MKPERKKKTSLLTGLLEGFWDSFRLSREGICRRDRRGVLDHHRDRVRLFRAIRIPLERPKPLSTSLRGPPIGLSPVGTPVYHRMSIEPKTRRSRSRRLRAIGKQLDRLERAACRHDHQTFGRVKLHCRVLRSYGEAAGFNGILVRRSGTGKSDVGLHSTV